MVLFSGCGIGEEAVPEAVEAAVPVMVAEAAKSDVEVAIDFTGVLEPETVVNVIKWAAKQLEVRVKDGDKVQAGSCWSDQMPPKYLAQVAQAEAARRLAEIQHEAAAKSFNDTEALYRKDIISRQQFEQTETQYKIAEAQVAQAEAALQLARTQLDDTLITAPLGGTVSGVTINPGELVSPGVPVAVINQTDTMAVSVQLTEKDVGRIADGQKVGVLVSAVSRIPGREVVKISPVADPAPKLMNSK